MQAYALFSSGARCGIEVDRFISHGEDQLSRVARVIALIQSLKERKVREGLSTV